jgi:hypothetical protein
MRLVDLEPELSGTLADGVLWFDCPFPACQQRGAHRVAVAVSAAAFHEREPRPNELGIIDRKTGKVKVWQASGEFPDSVTLQPSVNIVDDAGKTLCWHGHITNGEAA